MCIRCCKNLAALSFVVCEQTLQMFSACIPLFFLLSVVDLFLYSIDSNDRRRGLESINFRLQPSFSLFIADFLMFMPCFSLRLLFSLSTRQQILQALLLTASARLKVF